VVGVNQQVSIMACKCLEASGEGNVADVITCLEYVQTMKEQGINIIATSNSWVVNPGRRPGENFSQALYDAIEAQQQQGILFITAAGDDTKNNDRGHDVYPANFDLPNVIAVAATTSSDMLAIYSNVGRHTVHLAAPGGDNIFPGILSTLPGNAYGGLFGSTRAAVPHVTGVAALLQAQDLNRDWRAIKNLLFAGGDPLPDLADTTLTGRQLNARGSLTCTNAPVLSRFRPSSDTSSVALGTPVDVSVLDINCATPAGEVAVVVNPGNETIILRDSGVDGDQAAGDGLYTARWTPATAGTYTLTFPGREGQDDHVSVQVLANYTYTATPFVWRQITGANLNLWADFFSPPLPLPFAIPFGGVDYTTLYVSPHGTLNFTGPFTTSRFSDSANESIPTTASPTVVAPFWDRLAPQHGTDQNVFWAVMGNAPNREIVFEWRHVAYEFWLCNGDSAAGLTFQVVFFEGRSDILFNYAQTTFGGACPSSPDHGAGATVGVQVTSDTGTQLSFNTPSLHDQMALLWTVSQ